MYSLSYTATTVGDGEVVWCWEGRGPWLKEEKGRTCWQEGGDRLQWRWKEK